MVWQLGILGLEFVLNRDRALHGIHRTPKFGQQIIPRLIHHPTMMLLNEALHHLPVLSQGADSGHFIVAHEPTVALDIRTRIAASLRVTEELGIKALLYQQ